MSAPSKNLEPLAPGDDHNLSSAHPALLNKPGSPLAGAVEALSIHLQLKTLTPLYTGGVSMNGEQIHPAGLLGSIRRFSTLLGNALGDRDFAGRLWGLAEDNADDRHAKRVALRFDCHKLKTKALPSPIKCSQNARHRGWYFGLAQEGQLGMRLTARAQLDAADWNLLALALQIQTRHASFGAKDQFGLGVVEAADLAPTPLVEAVVEPGSASAAPIRPGLQDAFFARLLFACPAPPDLKSRMEAGLHWRSHLRDSLRARERVEEAAWKSLRHYTMGKLNQYGSAVNVSAIYPISPDQCALRIWGVLPHTQPAPNWFDQQRAHVLRRLQNALDPAGQGPALPCRPSQLEWLALDDAHRCQLPLWINRLAGLSL